MKNNIKSIIGILLLSVIMVGITSCEGISYKDPREMSNKELLDQYEKISNKIGKCIENDKEIDEKLKNQYEDIVIIVSARSWKHEFTDKEEEKLKDINVKAEKIYKDYVEWSDKSEKSGKSYNTGNTNNDKNVMPVDDDDDFDNDVHNDFGVSFID